MNQIKIEVAVEATNVDQLMAVANFMTALAAAGGNSDKATEAEPAKEAKEAKLEKKTTTRKTKAKADTEQVEAASDTTSPEPTKEDTKPESAPAEGKVTIEEVRAALAPKTENFRAEIKQKLTELGAKNVTTLEVEHYGEFLNFLQAL